MKEGLGLDLETTAVMVVVSRDNCSGCHRTSRFSRGSLNQIERERERERYERFGFKDYHRWWWRQALLKELREFWS